MLSNRYGVIYGLSRSKELCMTDEDLHALVYSLTRKNSLKKLSEEEVKQVTLRLAELKDSVRRQKRKKQNYTSRGTRGTERQRKKIFKLMQGLGWNEERVRGFARKLFGVECVEWLDYSQCSNLIEAMKAMLERQEK